MKLSMALLIAMTASAGAAQASALICKSKYTQITAQLENGAIVSTKANSAEGEDLHASVLWKRTQGETVSEYVFALEALDDNCIIRLPNDLRPSLSFVAHLKCYDDNGVMTNNRPVEGQAGPLEGEQMRCFVQ